MPQVRDGSSSFFVFFRFFRRLNCPIRVAAPAAARLWASPLELFDVLRASRFRPFRCATLDIWWPPQNSAAWRLPTTRLLVHSARRALRMAHRPVNLGRVAVHLLPHHFARVPLADKMFLLPPAPARLASDTRALAGKLFRSERNMLRLPAARADQRGKTILRSLRGSRSTRCGSVLRRHRTQQAAEEQMCESAGPLHDPFTKVGCIRYAYRAALS
jgi:hypothetical protein